MNMTEYFFLVTKRIWIFTFENQALIVKYKLKTKKQNVNNDTNDANT